jgi:hypothetical protein
MPKQIRIDLFFDPNGCGVLMDICANSDYHPLIHLPRPGHASVDCAKIHKFDARRQSLPAHW